MVFETSITFLVQVYYIGRLYCISKNAWIGVFLLTLCLLRLGGGVRRENRLGWLITTIIESDFGTDQSNYPCFFPIIYQCACLLTFSVGTGFLARLVSVAVVVCFQSTEDNYVWIRIFVLLTYT
ncbi:hypothetical protein B0H12DRAFT_690332 [Mycena haematopus]|nr:hypothetical protein B0H12DRAFT_690332 [Mycena haematopus]